MAAVEGAHRAVAASLHAGRFPLVVGGDDAAVAGWLAAARDQAGRIGLLYIDGHEDAWPPDGSPTGESADSGLGFALGLLRDAAPPQLSNLLPVVGLSDVTLLGPRDAGELAEAGVASLAGIARVLDDHAVEEGDAMEIMPPGPAQTWLHVDLDVLASDALGAVDYHQPGGLRWETLEALTVSALSDPRCVGWSVVDLNPDLAEPADVERVRDFMLGALAASGRLRA